MKIHLGSGRKRLPGFHNVDIDPSNSPEFVSDIVSLSFLGNNQVEEVYACHVVEHLRRTQVSLFFQEMSRVIKPGGLLRIAVPDFEAVVYRYLETKSVQELMGLLYGGQKNEHDYHYCGFDYNLLYFYLSSNGFKNIRRYDATGFLGDQDDYSKARLPHMDESGTLMSLNVVGEKA